MSAGGEQRGLSLRNPRVQHLRRLIGRRRARSEHAQFTFEGPTLLAEAGAARFPVQSVFVDRDEVDRHATVLGGLPDDTEVVTLAPGVLARVSDTTSPQGIVAVAPRPVVPITTLLSDVHGWIVVLDGVGDPGNAGTIVRTAEAFGARAVVFAGASADPFGPKAVRAAAGSAFRVPLVEHGSSPDAMEQLLEHGYAGCATVVDGGAAPGAVDLTGPLAVVFGSESHGVASEVLELPLRRLTIPVRGVVESLNVASAAVVIGYERARQLDAAGSPA